MDDCRSLLLFWKAEREEDTVFDIEFDTELSVDNGFNFDRRVGDVGSFWRSVDRLVAPAISISN